MSESTYEDNNYPVIQLNFIQKKNASIFLTFIHITFHDIIAAPFSPLRTNSDFLTNLDATLNDN